MRRKLAAVGFRIGPRCRLCKTKGRGPRPARSLLSQRAYARICTRRVACLVFGRRIDLCERRVRQPIDAATKDGQVTDQPARYPRPPRRSWQSRSRDAGSAHDAEPGAEAIGSGYAAHAWRYRAAQAKLVPYRPWDATMRKPSHAE